MLVLVLTIGFIFKAQGPTAFEVIQASKENVSNEIKLVETVEDGKTKFMYTIGRIDDDAKEMFFFDEVKQTLFSNRWQGGGGHVFTLFPTHLEPTFSVQLMNEKQGVQPTLFGTLADPQVTNIAVKVNRDVYEAKIIPYRSSVLFYVFFNKPVQHVQRLTIEWTQGDGSHREWTIKGEDMEKFQQGDPFWYNNEMRIDEHQ